MEENDHRIDWSNFSSEVFKASKKEKEQLDAAFRDVAPLIAALYKGLKEELPVEDAALVTSGYLYILAMGGGGEC